jgi:soluble lytic murein transglycosylase-like protein
MMIQPKGYEATMRRVEELKARLDLVKSKPQEPMPSPTNTPLEGSIPSNSYAPLNPFGAGKSMSQSGAPENLKSLIDHAAAQTGVDPVLLESLVQAESDFNPKEVSHVGAMGLTQLMPGTAKSLGVTDPFDPAQNLLGGAKYLAQMLKQFGGDERLALAGYNAGPGAVKRFGGIPPYKETQHYVDRIMTRVTAMRGKP